MVPKFPRILSSLRQEAGVSQREAAAFLGVSQALLSHYENGIREPGLSFVLRACDYYGVTADQLLGREPRGSTAAPDGHHIPVTKYAEQVASTVTIISSFLKGMDNPSAARWAESYLSAALYDIFRQLCQFSPGYSEAIFTIDDLSFNSGVTMADLSFSRTQYHRALAARRPMLSESMRPITPELLVLLFPDDYQAALHLLRNAGLRMHTSQECLLHNVGEPTPPGDGEGLL